MIRAMSVPMAQAPVATQIHEPLDVAQDLSAQIPFDAILVVDDHPQLLQFVIVEFPRLAVETQPSLGQDLSR